MTDQSPDLIAVGPTSAPPYAGLSVTRAGGRITRDLAQAAALIWLDPYDVDGLAASLAAARKVRWVQLPFAGVERMAMTGMLSDGRVWTSAKGAYAEPVAEHALALTLAGLRLLPTRLRAASWGEQAGTSLFDAPVTILGGGGIAQRLIALLRPFRANVTVLRRSAGHLDGADRTLPISQLDSALVDALVVVLALALTPETKGIIGAEQLAHMRPDAWLINVARGAHVHTEALVSALRNGGIGGAALDVTDPEPLPDGHPLWAMPNAIVTPHTADTPQMIEQMLGDRIEQNVGRFLAGQALLGLVDPAAGY